MGEQLHPFDESMVQGFKGFLTPCSIDTVKRVTCKKVVGSTSEAESTRASKEQATDAIMTIFTSMDSDGSGLITKDEFSNMKYDSDVMAALLDLGIKDKQFDMYVQLLYNPMGLPDSDDSNPGVAMGLEMMALPRTVSFVKCLVSALVLCFSLKTLGFCGQWSKQPEGRIHRRAWFEVTKGPELELSEANQGRVLPIFPSPSVLWPGAHVQFAVIEPGHRKLYEDLLMSGARRVLAPLVDVPISGRPGGRPSRYRLHSMAALLNLEDLIEATEQTDGLVKYVAKHRVVGRAKIQRLLNPSALFDLNEKQEKTQYLRAEAEILPVT
eukprot:symbB.v1.2.024200.t1/scaffold2271.1/size83755/8